MADIHVPAPARGRHDGMLPGFGRGDTDRPWKRPIRQRDAVAPGDRPPIGVYRRDPQPRIGELRREQAEAWDYRRPTPAAGAEGHDLDLEHIAGPCALHEHRPADRIHV